MSSLKDIPIPWSKKAELRKCKRVISSTFFYFIRHYNYVRTYIDYQAKYAIINFMNRIKEILKERNMTQEELSLRCGVPQSEISRIANGKKKAIHLETAAKIARGLGKPVEYVFPDY